MRFQWETLTVVDMESPEKKHTKSPGKSGKPTFSVLYARCALLVSLIIYYFIVYRLKLLLVVKVELTLQY